MHDQLAPGLGTSTIEDLGRNIARLANAQEATAAHLARLVEVLSPIPADKVGSRYISDRLGCTVTYVSEMVRNGRIPNRCVVPGTGGGKRLLFYRERIDQWLREE